MRQPGLLGIDVGTTAIKVGVFDFSGRVLALRQAPTPIVWDGPESAHHDAEALWAAVAGLLGQLEPEHKGGVEAVGVSSFGEAGTLVDGAGRARVPLLAWFDARPGAALGRLRALMPDSAWRARAGLLPDSSYGLCKLLWLREHHPEAFAGARWVSAADWVAFRLTGVRQIGLTQASRTLALDLRRGRWWDEALGELGLGGVLADLRLPGEAVGRVTPEAAAQTGLPAGLRVMESGHDQPLAAAGVGAQAAGTLVNSCGTSEVLFGVFGREGLAGALAGSGVAVGAYALGEKFYAMATLRASGAAWDWWRRVASGLHPATHEQLIEAARAAPFGSEGVRFLPHLRRLGDDPAQPEPPGGVFSGLRETHGLGHLTRAVLEGLSFELWRLLRGIEATGRHAPPVRAVGGGTRNALWMQTKADLLQTRLETYASPHAAAWGAAWLAGHHLGLVDSFRPEPQASYAPRADPAGLIAAYQEALARQVQALSPDPSAPLS